MSIAQLFDNLRLVSEPRPDGSVAVDVTPLIAPTLYLLDATIEYAAEHAGVDRAAAIFDIRMLAADHGALDD